MGNSVIYRPAYDAEVEYLESDGNSYIDTGLKASSELGILAHIYVTGIFPFGGRNGLNNKEFSFCALQNGDSGFRFGRSIAIAQVGRLNGLYEFDNTQNHNILKVGNTSYVATYNSFISDYNVFLFGLNNAGVAENISSRIYDFKIYNNSTLVRDYIPVRIGSIGYLYDKVSKQLFANKGTGNFILGNDVVNAVIPQQRCVLYFGNQRSVGFERIYEEYEWLCGRNGAYIDTNHQLVSINDCFAFRAKYNGTIRNDIGNEQNVFGYSESENSNINYMLCRAYINGAGNYNINYYIHQASQDDYGWQALNDKEVTSDISANTSNYVFTINGQSTTRASNILQSQTYGNIYLFGLNIIGQTRVLRYFNGDIAHFRIYHGNIDYVNMTPCRLLRPIPAILDGNGIARQAGECGMWDKVSNKFYGNVANSGTFTVKGPKCYEEYDWLVGDGSAYIDTNIKNLTNVHYIDILISVDVISSSSGSCFFGRESVVPYYNSQIVLYYVPIRQNISVWTSSDGHEINFGGTVGNVTLNFDTNIASTPTDSVAISVRNYNSAFSIFLFADNSNGNPVRIFTGKIKKLEIDDIIHLVPCKLTHGIPASMDANGIARSSGTCGMWDKVNDKFYGNVASSGTFTVSND